MIPLMTRVRELHPLLIRHRTATTVIDKQNGTDCTTATGASGSDSNPRRKAGDRQRWAACPSA